MSHKNIATIGLVAAVAVAFWSGPASAIGRVNDFPTEARAEYVFACMSSNERNREFLHKCSCAIDAIASRMSYDDYVQVETILSLQQLHTPNIEAYRGLDVVKEPLDKLFRGEAAAELKCF